MFSKVKNCIPSIIKKCVINTSQEFDVSPYIIESITDCFTKTIITHGKFTCPKCKNTWASARVVMLLNMELYDPIKCYAQDCRKCKKIGNLELFEEVTIERITNNLIIRCGGVNKEYTKKRVNTKKAHDSKNCHACNAGHCIRD